MANTLRQQLALLLIAVMALQLSHAWLLKLPKLEDLSEKLDEKQQKEALKKLDFLNLFAAKEEKKADEWEKIKEWFEDKKLKQLDLFEAIKEKEQEKKEKLVEKLEEKLDKKLNKKQKKIAKPTTECDNQYYEYTTKASYKAESEEKYQEEAEEEEEEQQEVVVVKKPKKTCNCPEEEKSYSYVPTAYDVRDDDEEGIRYFT
ncbi:rho GTPase-activating protein gacV isoform X2 [Drosophila hydei]|uniref:Rho GTPase-activating protein gacV isoform X2 n=1 Tax=Drosophila hydei TaxID=7224 RepID=A0A6J1LC03_DROHY|nr:rho GTPase-activating protein gacV isoform X2 [Drosophila hydei]